MLKYYFYLKKIETKTDTNKLTEEKKTGVKAKEIPSGSDEG